MILGEAKAIWFGLKTAQEQGFLNVVIESDVETLIRKINSDVATYGAESTIIDSILNVAESFSSCLFRWVDRKFNGVAHKLSVWARSNRLSYSWIDDFPSWLVNDLSRDAFGY